MATVKLDGFTEREALEIVLLGLQQRQQEIESKVVHLRSTILAHHAGSAVPRRKTHRISAEGRARIAAAQRKRWAAIKKA